MEKMEYKRAFDSVSAPANAMDNVLSRVSPRPRPAVRRMALTLAAVLVLTCGAAFASGVAGEWLDAIISLNGRLLPAANLQKIGRTAEEDGLRLTLNSVASDGVHTYFLVDIEALDGQDLSNSNPEAIPMEDSLYVEAHMELPSSGGYAFRAIRIDDGSDPLRAQLVFKFDFGVPRNGSRLTLVVDEVGCGIWTTSDSGKRLFSHEMIAEGEWSFSFRLNGNLDGTHYAISGFDYDVSISPFGMAINGIGSRRFGQNAYLLLQDGSQVVLTGHGVSSGERNGKTYRELVSYEFTELIDPSQAAALLIDGKEYPLK